MTLTEKTIVGLVIILVLGLPFLFGSFVVVGAGERGVLLTWGAFNGTVLTPGFHLKLPLAQSVIKMSVQTQAAEIEKSEAYSHDLQVVDIHSLVNLNVDPTAVGLVYQKYGLNFTETILRARIEAGVKQTIAKYTAEELLSKRGEVQDQIESLLKQTIPVEFIVTKYSLVNEQFSTDFENAIEAKQVSQQKAEQAKNELAKTEVDAQARVAQAKGEAEAIKIQASAIQSQGGADYVKLQAIAKWSGVLPQYLTANAPIPFLDLTTK